MNEKDIIKKLVIARSKPQSTQNLSPAELSQLLLSVIAGAPDRLLLERLAIDAAKPKDLHDPSPAEMADLVLTTLEYVRRLSLAIKRPDLVTDGVVESLIPQPDRDYLSAESAQKLITSLNEASKKDILRELNQIAASIRNGRDGSDGKDGKNGKDGRDGRDGKDGKDGKDAIITEQHLIEAASIAAGLIQLPDFPTLITQEPEAIRNALELLQDDARLDIKAIKGLPEIIADLQTRKETTQKVLTGKSSIAFLNDVSILNPTNGQVLAYNSTTGRWENQDAGAGEVIIEVADYASLPVTGEEGVLYVTIDNNRSYRWSGSTYVEVSPTEPVGFGDITGDPSDNALLDAALDAKADAAATTSALAAKVSKAGDSMSGALVIAGSSNTTQLKVTGHSTQTANVFELYNQLYGSPTFAVANNGTTYARSRVTGTDGGITLTTGANPTVDIRGDVSNGYYPGINFYWAGGTLTGSITGYNGLTLSAAPGFSAGVWSYYQNTPAWYVKSGFPGQHTVPLLAVRGYQAGTAHPFNVNQDGAIQQHGATASWNKSLAKRTSVAASVSGSGSSFAGGVTYYYKVTACNFVGETIGSAEVSATPAAGQNVNLTWGYVNMDGVDHVRVYRSTTAGSYGASSRVDTGLYTSGTGVPYYSASFTDTGYTPTAGTPPTAITHDIMTYRIWEGQTGKVIDVENYDGTTLAQWKADGNIEVPTEAFGAGWASSSEVPTKGDTYTALQGKQDALGGAVLPTAVNAADTSNRIIIQDPNASGNVATILVTDLPSGGGGVSFAQALAIGYLNL